MAHLKVASQTITSNTALLRITGEMDAGDFDILEDEFGKLLESGVTGLVMDISGLNSLSSAGLGAVLNLSRMLGGRQGKLVLAAARPKILGDLELLGLGEALTIADTIENAKKLVIATK